MATLRKITETDLANKGVMPLADVPGLSAEDMKAKFEEIVRSVVIPIFNQNMQDIEDAIFGGLTPGSEYLVTGDEITTYDGIKAVTEARKVATAVAVKEMNTAIQQTLSTYNEQLILLWETTYVVYKPNGGTGTMYQDVTSTHNDRLKLPNTEVGYTKAGYTFAGWALDDAGTGTKYVAGDTITNVSHYLVGPVLTLYATWQENTP